MDIKEVLKLPDGTKVKCNGEDFTVTDYNNTKVLETAETRISVCLSLAFIEAEYELVRKKLNFFKAMALVSEGKTIESSNAFIYKKSNDGVLVQRVKEDVKEEFDTEDIIVDEILSDWYEVIE